jgi:hypothetical protein
MVDNTNIKKLLGLSEPGVITEEEFSEMQNNLMRRMDSSDISYILILKTMIQDKKL